MIRFIAAGLARTSIAGVSVAAGKNAPGTTPGPLLCTVRKQVHNTGYRF